MNVNYSNCQLLPITHQFLKSRFQPEILIESYNLFHSRIRIIMLKHIFTPKQFSDSAEDTATPSQDNTFNPAMVLFPKRRTKSRPKNANKKYSQESPVRPRMGARSLSQSKVARPHAQAARASRKNNKVHSKSNVKMQKSKSANVSRRPSAL